MLFHRHPLKEQSLESRTSDVSGTSCCNNNNRCGCDCQGPPGPRGCTGPTGATGPAGPVTSAAAVTDATGQTDVVTQFNQLLSSLRAAGILNS